MTTRKLLLALLTTALAGAACGTPVADDVPAQDVTETQGAITRWYYTWGSSSAETDIGSADDRTCFLSGVAGNLSTGEGDPSKGWDPGFAGVFRAPNNDYIIDVEGGVNGQTATGSIVMSGVTCIGTAAGRGDAYEVWEGTTVDLGSTANSRQCFLKSISGGNQTWIHATDDVQVWRNGGKWWLGGAVQSPANAPAQAQAVCVNLPAGTTVTTGTAPGPSSGVGTTSIAHDTGGTVCALTGYKGKLNENAWDSGAVIHWPTSIPGNWTISVKAGRTADWVCMQ
jgi:hypothetical protein